MKKLFAIFMIAMMLMCFMPSAAFASESSTDNVQIGKYYEVDDNTGKLPDAPELEAPNTQQSYEDGQVLVKKTITETGIENIFDVNLEVITKDKIKQTEVSEDAAVVLVIDVSNSMSQDSRLQKAKEAAQAFINSFADAGPTVQRKAAIVKFSGNHNDKNKVSGAATVERWIDARTIARSEDDQCTAISGLRANGGTNLAAGIQLAKNLLAMDDVKSIANRNIVVLTDGEPTYGIGTNVENGTDAVCSNGSNMIGTGSTLLGEDGKLHSWYNPDYHKIHVQAESISQSLGSSGITPYAVFIGDDKLHCLGENTRAEAYSEKEQGHDRKPEAEVSSCEVNNKKCSTWLATKCGFTTIPVNNINELTLAFERISKLIKLQAQAWQLTDPMGEYIDCIAEFTNDDMKDGISYDETTETLHWNLKLSEPEESEGAYKYSFNYKIKLDNLAADFTPETLYPANGVTSLTYLITGSFGGMCGEPSLKTAYFNIPSVKGLAGKLEFTKVGEDENALAGAEFTLTAKDNPNYKITASSNENGKVIFTNVPSGHGYTLEETTVPTGYEKADNSAISVDFGVVSGIAGGIIKNQPETTSVKVIKDWNDNENQDGKRPGSITVQLLANSSVVEGKSLVLNSGNGWKGSFDNLPKYKSGEKIIYTVKETDVDGYTSEITGDAQNGFVIKNTHTPETTSVSGNKTWNDDGNRDRKRPETITINLLKNGAKVDSKTVSKNDNWSWNFANLPKYENGAEISYSISEEKVADYSTTRDGYNLTNSYTPGKTSVAVTKVWNDSDNKDKIRPENVTVKLLVNGNETNQTVVLSAGNQWSSTFTNLPINEDGKPVNYSVEEVAVPNGYKAVVTNNTENDFTITNTHAPNVNPPIGPTYTSVSVHKEWKLDDGGTAADSVNVQLYRNGVKYPGGEVTLSKDNNWSHTWRSLYVYGDVWTVEEVNVPEGFTATVTKAAYTNDFTVINDDVKPDPTEPTEPEKPTKPEKPDKPDKPAKPCKPETEVPKTGDTAPDAMLINTLALTLSALGGMLIWYRKKQEDK